MSAFAKTDIPAINAAGVLAFEASGVAEELKTNLASTAAPTAIEALDTVKALCEGREAFISATPAASSVIY